MLFWGFVIGLFVCFLLLVVVFCLVCLGSGFSRGGGGGVDGDVVVVMVVFVVVMLCLFYFFVLCVAWIFLFC